MLENRIKEIGEQGINASVDVIRESFSTVADEFGLTKENSPSNGAFLDYGRLFDDYKRGIKMFGLFKNEKQIGFVALEKKDNSLFYLEKLSVLPEHRHKGYGRMLMDFAKGFVAEHGGSEISIGIIYENKRLLSWYESYGFMITGTKQFDHLSFVVCFMKLDIQN